jgi:hypothetical protein
MNCLFFPQFNHTVMIRAGLRMTSATRSVHAWIAPFFSAPAGVELENCFVSVRPITSSSRSCLTIRAHEVDEKYFLCFGKRDPELPVSSPDRQAVTQMLLHLAVLDSNIMSHRT